MLRSLLRRHRAASTRSPFIAWQRAIIISPPPPDLLWLGISKRLIRRDRGSEKTKSTLELLPSNRLKLRRRKQTNKLSVAFSFFFLIFNFLICPTSTSFPFSVCFLHFLLFPQTIVCLCLICFSAFFTQFFFPPRPRR